MFRPIVIASAALLAGPAIAAQNATQSTNQSSGVGDIASIVDSEFPAYDTNRSGMLEQPEFSKWMVALKEQEMKATGKAIPSTEVTAWASGAFVSADADRSDAVSKPELITYLSGGAA
jgi:hypothetical protein